jgi:hypothetical protein
MLSMLGSLIRLLLLMGASRSVVINGMKLTKYAWEKGDRELYDVLVRNCP